MRRGIRSFVVCLIWLAAASLPVASAQFLVAQDGSGTHTTIQGALNAAQYGDTIFVSAGTYVEGLRFKNGVHLVGSGANATIIRHGYGFEPAVSATHASAGTIEGFTIERTGSALAASAVRIESASIRIVDCTILGAQESGVEVVDGTSNPSLTGCTIRDNDGHGVWARDGARVALDGCRIERNGGAGLCLTESSEGDVTRTDVVGNRGGGVSLGGTATATFTDSSILGSQGWGITLQDGCSAGLERCTLASNTTGGILVSDDAEVTLSGCLLEGGATGFVARDSSGVLAVDATIRDAVGIGADVRGGASVTLRRLAVDGSGGHGVRLASSAPCSIDHGTLVRNGGSGLLIEGSNVSVSNTILAYNEGPGLDVDPDGDGGAGDVVLSYNNVWSNGGGDYAGVVPRPTDVVGPPEFADLRAGDLSLRPESPCIGRGFLGKTIGAHPDPGSRSAVIVDLLPAIHEGIFGFHIGARARFEPSPFSLETLEATIGYAEGPIELAVRSSFAGRWGRRTVAHVGLALVPLALQGITTSVSVEADGVLDGIESWASLAFGASFEGAAYGVAARLSKTWPAILWGQQIDVRLGSNLRLEVRARALGFSPRDLVVTANRLAATAAGSSSFSVTWTSGEDQTLGLAADWESDARSVSASVSTYLGHLDHVAATLDIREKAARAALSVTGSLDEGRLTDGEITVSKGFGDAELACCLGINEAGRARVSLTVEALLSFARPSLPNVLPIPSFVVLPEDPQAGDPVSFDASAASDPDGDIVDYWWDYGDGGAELGRAVEHVFSEAGTYEVSLTVVDDAGATATLVLPLTVWEADSGPAAAFVWEPVSEAGTTLPRPLRAGDRIRLDASASFDPSGRSLDYQWDLDSDGGFELTSAEPILLIDPMEAGSHPVTLRIVNADGRSEARMHAIVVAEPKAPLARFTLTPSSPSVLDPIRFSDDSVDVDGRLVAWDWSFGDGHTSREPSPIHRYENAGTYTVALRVTDEDGLADRVELSVPVAVVPEITPVEDVWVLAIGISDYETVRDLQFGREDAEAVVTWAVEQGIPAERIRLLTDEGDPSTLPASVETKRATLLNVREALGWLRRVASPDDLVLIFYSGHGYQSLDDGTDERDGVDEFFVLADTLEGAVEDTALRDDEFGRFLDRVASEHVIVFFDGCHSGGLARSLPGGHRPVRDVTDVFQDFALEGRLVLSAAAESQEAYESTVLGHGVFTHFVLEGLRGSADRNGDRRVTAWELYEYLVAEVPPFVMNERGAEQTPQIEGEGDVRVLIAREPDPVVAAFSFDPTVPFVGGLTRFRNETTGGWRRLEWTFGDGETSGDEAPVHVFEESGGHLVSLAVTAPGSAVSTASQEITIAPAGRVLEQAEAGWILSLGAQNGIRLGDRLEVLDAESGLPSATLEIIELLGPDAALGRAIDPPGTPPLGGALRPLGD
jgi:PKD repeat protein